MLVSIEEATVRFEETSDTAPTIDDCPPSKVDCDIDTALEVSTERNGPVLSVRVVKEQLNTFTEESRTATPAVALVSVFVIREESSWKVDEKQEIALLSPPLFSLKLHSDITEVFLDADSK